jgi:hypothetical protein
MMRLGSHKRERGFSLFGLLSTLTLLGAVGVLLVRAGPSVIEYWAIGKAVTAASIASGTPDELRRTFDKLAAAGYIDSIEGKDLEIAGKGPEMEISFAYQKKIPLVGPASLLIDYRGSTAQAVPEKAAN